MAIQQGDPCLAFVTSPRVSLGDFGGFSTATRIMLPCGARRMPQEKILLQRAILTFVV